MMLSPDELAIIIKAKIRNLELKNQHVADKSGVSKYMVSKVVNGKMKRIDSGSVLKICNFLDINLDLVNGAPKTSNIDPSSSKVLMDALRETWDGRPETAIVLADLIRAVYFAANKL